MVAMLPTSEFKEPAHRAQLLVAVAVVSVFVVFAAPIKIGSSYSLLSAFRSGLDSNCNKCPVSGNDEDIINRASNKYC